MDFTGFYWVLLDFPGSYWVLLDFPGSYWVLLGFTGSFFIFSNIRVSIFFCFFFKSNFKFDNDFSVLFFLWFFLFFWFVVKSCLRAPAVTHWPGDCFIFYFGRFYFLNDWLFLPGFSLPGSPRAGRVADVNRPSAPRFLFLVSCFLFLFFLNYYYYFSFFILFASFCFCSYFELMIHAHAGSKENRLIRKRRSPFQPSETQ